MITTTISSKNQITIPNYLLNILKIKSGDKLLVKAENHQLCLKPVGKSLVESLAGSITIKKAKKGIPFAEVLTETKKTVAQKLASK